MKQNKRKIAFGIAKDGFNLKLAQLVQEAKTIKIQALEETLISTPLFREEKLDTAEAISEEVETSSEEEIDMPEISDLEDNDFEIPGLSDYNKDESVQKEESGYLPGFKEFQNFLQIFPLNSGKISLNTEDDKISYLDFDSDFGKKNVRKKLSKEMLTSDEIKAKNFTIDFIQNSDKSGLGFVQRGSSELFRALQEINTILTKERYFYSYQDTNEIALMNLIRHNYNFPDDEYVLILYIGEEYKAGIVMKNKEYVKNFPIIVPDSDKTSVLQTVYSKVMLEQDISDIVISKNIIIAGEYVEDGDIEFFKDKAAEDDNIERLKLPNIQVHSETQEIITPEMIAKFAIPISLAWKTLDSKNKDFYSSNLIPTKIIEDQKYFKIAWHGFIILIAIFYFAFQETIKNLELKQDIKRLTRSNYNVERQLSKNREIITRLNEIKTDISAIETSIKKIDSIVQNKNQWHYIIDRLSQSLQKNPLSWLNDISSNNEGFEIHGFTSSRRNLLDFSQLFPSGKLSNVAKMDVQEMDIWKFDLFYSYPDREELAKQMRTEQKQKVESQVAQIEKNEKISEPTPTANGIRRKYNEILSEYFAGNFQSAYEKFSAFIQNHKSHELAYDARYFLGEILYQLNRIPEAKKVFQDIYNIYSYKSADALLMLGNCSQKENNIGQAKKYWQQLIREFPESSVAKAAKYKMQKLRVK